MDVGIVPQAGEVWDAYLDPTVGREQSGRRPVLVVSSNGFNRSGRALAIIVPITGTEAHVRYQLQISAGEGGLTKDSTLLPEHVRSVDFSRLKKFRGMVSMDTLERTRQLVFTLLLD